MTDDRQLALLPTQCLDDASVELQPSRENSASSERSYPPGLSAEMLAALRDLERRAMAGRGEGRPEEAVEVSLEVSESDVSGNELGGE